MPATKNFDLRNIKQVPAGNIGGVDAVWYTLAANILNWPTVGGLVIPQLAMAPGTFWYQLVSTRSTVRYKQAPKPLGRHGDIYQQRLAGTISRHSAELAQGLEALAGQELVALYRDRNGQMQLLGTPEQPLGFQSPYDSGADPINRNNYDWTLQADTPRPARPYQGTWVVSAVGLDSGLELGQASGGVVEIRDARGQIMATVPAGRTVVLRSGFRVAYTIL
jgi:hypothetical protein